MEYVKHILTIKLWEWEGIKEKASTSMMVFPNSEDSRTISIASNYIKEIKDAIKALEKLQSLTP